MIGKLYVVATPIGNLDDITRRAARVLAEADIIAAEDTRRTRILLQHLDIKTAPVSCHKFNETGKLAFFLQALTDGKDIALVSDAGTPCLSDPGHRLVAGAAEHGAEVVGVCGPNAAVTALSVSGFDASAFAYAGFLPRNKKDIRALFETRLSPGAPPLVFYESPKRIAGTIQLLTDYFAGTRLCLCNDLTKKFERVYRGTPAQVSEDLTENLSSGKGEYTCVVEWPRAGETSETTPYADASGIGEAGAEARNGGNAYPSGDSIPGSQTYPHTLSLEAELADIMVKSPCSLKEAVSILHERHSGKRTAKLTKKEIYAASLRLKEMFTHD